MEIVWVPGLSIAILVRNMLPYLFNSQGEEKEPREGRVGVRSYHTCSRRRAGIAFCDRMGCADISIIYVRIMVSPLLTCVQ